jgi:tRNA A-37 threonylcarbamoyl transferase component Bud32
MAAAGRDIDIDKLMASGQVLKDDTATTVVRTTWSGRDVVIKRYNYRGFLRALADVVRGSRAKRAWQKGQFLRRIGIPTPEPLTFIETKKYGLVRESFLITPYIGGTNFHYYIRNENNRAGQTQHVVEKIKNILETLALHKISHGDTKPTNLLVAADGPVITDLDSMKIHWTASMAKRGAKKDLDKFVTRVNSSDVSDEMKQICASACGYSGQLPYQFANDYFKIPSTRNNCWNMFIRQGFHPEDATAMIEGGVCCDEKRYGRQYSSKMARIWTATASFKGRDIEIFIKEHLHRSVIDFIKHLFRNSRARRALKASLMLRRNGLDCPEPLALLEKYRGPFCTNSILITEGITESVNLNKYLNKLKAENITRAEAEKKVIIRELGSYVGKMHELGIFHGDLRTGNILVQNDKGFWRFFMVDNERTRQFSVIPRRLIIKNLVQLNMFRTGISNIDRIRFIRAYNGQMQLTDDEIRRLCKSVIQKTDKRLKIRAGHTS